MAVLMFVGTDGSNDPTKAAMPFLGAKGAVDAGLEGEIFLLGEAVYLMKREIAEAVVPVGWPPLTEWMDEVAEAGVTVFV